MKVLEEFLRSDIADEAAALCLLGRLDPDELKVEGLDGPPPSGQAVHLVVQVRLGSYGKSAVWLYAVCVEKGTLLSSINVYCTLMVLLCVKDGLEVYLPMAGLVDKEKEMARLEKQSGKLAKDIEVLEKRLSGSNFVEKVWFIDMTYFF